MRSPSFSGPRAIPAVREMEWSEDWEQEVTKWNSLVVAPLRYCGVSWEATKVLLGATTWKGPLTTDEPPP